MRRDDRRRGQQHLTRIRAESIETWIAKKDARTCAKRAIANGSRIIGLHANNRGGIKMKKAAMVALTKATTAVIVEGSGAAVLETSAVEAIE